MHVKKPLDPKLKWFKEARFGMFIHFGLYALLGRGEWVMLREDIRREDYEPLMDRFNPSEFDADEWIQKAKRVGCRYMTVTAKHHDGFCLWDTDLTDFKITNTPFGRDLIGELIEACHRRDFRICLYYSQPDWHHPNYVHRPGAFKDLQYERPEDDPDWAKFLEYYQGQVEELCTKYGRIDGIWFDGVQRTEQEWEGEKVYRMIKSHQPQAVVNDRAGYGDFYTPERSLSHLNAAAGYMVEACQSVCEEVWGYHRDPTLFSSVELLENLVRMAGAGGNYLLNVGPTPDGTLPEAWMQRLYDMGEWLIEHGEAIYGTDGAPMHMSDEVVYTRSGRKVWAHLLQWPQTNRVKLEALSAEPVSAHLHGTDVILQANTAQQSVTLGDLPATPQSWMPAVIEMEFDTSDIFRPVPETPEPPAVSLQEGETHLVPEDAAVQGFGIKGSVLSVDEVSGQTRGGPEVNTAFSSNWIPGQVAEWPLRVSEPVELEVIALIACPDLNAGATFRVTMGDIVLEGRVPPTGGFDTYVPVSLGSVELDKTATTVAMEPETLHYANCFGRVGGIILRTNA